MLFTCSRGIDPGASSSYDGVLEGFGVRKLACAWSLDILEDGKMRAVIRAEGPAMGGRRAALGERVNKLKLASSTRLLRKVF